MTKPVVLLLTFLALAGCGRRAPLDPPPGTPPNQPAGSVDTTSTMGGDVNAAVPPTPQQAPTTGSNATPPAKGQPFLLDPLVK